ncbi:MAG: glycosyltransferase family 4 protein [Planctomycetota bacterium]|nr:glycosyltransferase family 4 protein [Planctomycetota bacterium]
MRIARVLTRLNLGGPARQALAADTQLAARGHDVRLYAGTPLPGEGDLFDDFVARGLSVERVPGLGRGITGVGDLRALAALKSRFRAFQPDVVHTHASKAGALGRRAAAASVPRAARVHTFHGHVLEGYFPEPISRGLVALEARLARDTDRVLAVAHATAEDLLRLKVLPDERRLLVVPPGIDLDPFLAIEKRHGALRGLVGAKETDYLVGVVGRLAEVKQPELALDVLGLLAVKYPRLQLVYVGDGELRGSLERRIRALSPDLQARVHMVGAQTDMPAILADLDAVLLTSRAEGAPVALIEAAAAGKPAIAMSVGGVPELVAHERTGWLGASTDELAYGLSQFLENPALSSGLAVRARLRVEKRHSAAALADRLEDVYARVVEERTCAS